MSKALAKDDTAYWQLVRDTYCKGASSDEFALFSTICKRLNLDPIAKQIYAVKRWDAGLRRESLTAQVSIDGFRIVAQRTGDYEGQTPVQWCGSDGVWKDAWVEEGYPAAARVGVYRHNFREAVFGVATFKSYAQRTRDGDVTKMWANGSDFMLAKCAEALALRKAFPELSGVYAPEEMMQADNVQHGGRPAPVPQAPAVEALPANDEDFEEEDDKMASTSLALAKELVKNEESLVEIGHLLRRQQPILSKRAFEELRQAATQRRRELEA